jgi:hypothetical protein
MKFAKSSGHPQPNTTSGGNNFYPFKEIDIYSNWFEPKVYPHQRFEKQVTDFYENKRIQAIDLLEDAMPGLQTASESHDRGMTRFEHIMSHYAKDMVMKPDSEKIMFLDPKPDMLAMHTMMGYNKHKEPHTFELLTHGIRK